jgi:hypothetical protein
VLLPHLQPPRLHTMEAATQRRIAKLRVFIWAYGLRLRLIRAELNALGLDRQGTGIISLPPARANSRIGPPGYVPAATTRL